MRSDARRAGAAPRNEGIVGVGDNFCRSRRSGARRDGAHLVGGIGLVTMIAAAEGEGMLVVLVLLLAEVASVESRKRLLH